MPNRFLSLLVVDDDPLVTRILCSQAEQLGFRVLGTAATGPEAVRLVEAHRPDLVLMDLLMPDPGTGKVDPEAGIAATRAIMARCPVPVVILSAYESSELVDKVTEAGAGAYLVKPSSERELARAVEIARARFEDQLKLRAANARLEQELAIQQRLEADLRASRQRLDLLVLETPLAVLEWDRAFRIVEWNPAAERIFGIPRSGALGLTVAELLLEGPDRDRFRHDMAAFLDRPASIHDAYWSPGREGEPVRCEWFITPLVDELGSTIGGAALCLDITQHSRAEEALAASEARYRALVDNSAEGIGMVDPEETFLFANSSLERIFGVPNGGLQGRSLRDFLDAEQFGRVRAQTRRRIQGRTDVYELDILRPDGHRRLVHVSATPQFSPAGSVQNAFGVFTDITESKLAERALSKSEARLRAVLSSAPVAMIALDREGRVTLAKGKVLEALGHQEDRDAGSTLADLFPEHPVLQETLAKAMAGEDAVETLQIRERTFECHLSPLQDDGDRPEGALLVILDIQDRTRAEEAEHQARKLESLALMAGGIAHDFNNLLQAVSGHLELALERLSPESPATTALRAAEPPLTRAARLTGELLHVSGCARCVMEPTDLGALVARSRGPLETLCGPRLLLRVGLAPDLPPVDADPSQVQRVLLALASNAVEAMTPPGTLTVRTLRAEVAEGDDLGPADRFVRPGSFAALEVTDTGCGIAPDLLPRILDPFFSTKFAGRGLGLASVLGILRAHGAALRVHSTPGQGSTFQLLFPVAARLDPAPAPPPGARVGPRQGRILVVDDEPDIRETVLEVLEALGYPSSEAADGQEALDHLRAHPGEVALVILDLTMPRLGGREAFQAIRAMDPAIRVIVSTGYSLQGVMDSFRDLEPDAFLPKPYRLKALKDLLERLLGPATA